MPSTRRSSWPTGYWCSALARETSISTCRFTCRAHVWRRCGTPRPSATWRASCAKPSAERYCIKPATSPTQVRLPLLFLHFLPVEATGMVRFVPENTHPLSRRPSLVKRILLLFILALLLIPAAARAQEAPGFSSLEIDLWPEYDRPDVLVIYKGVLSPQTTLPAKLTLRIPVAAGEPTAVAVGADPGSVADVMHTSQINGDWLEVSFVAAMPAIQFEYYEPT